MIEEVVVVVMSPVIAVELSVSTQTGTFAHELAKLSVQEVTMPDPTVIAPAVSVPTTDGLVPHVPMEGVVPEEITCPPYWTPKTGVPFCDEMVITKSDGIEAGVELTDTNAMPVGAEETVMAGPVVAPVNNEPFVPAAVKLEVDEFQDAAVRFCEESHLKTEVPRDVFEGPYPKSHEIELLFSKRPKFEPLEVAAKAGVSALTLVNQGACIPVSELKIPVPSTPPLKAPDLFIPILAACKLIVEGIVIKFVLPP